MPLLPSDGWSWPLALATMSGLSTSVGGLMAVIHKPSQSMLAGLLGSAIGVMATVSVAELIVRNALESDAFLVVAASTGGALAYYIIEPFFPSMEEPAPSRKQLAVEDSSTRSRSNGGGADETATASSTPVLQDASIGGADSSVHRKSPATERERMYLRKQSASTGRGHDADLDSRDASPSSTDGEAGPDEQPGSTYSTHDVERQQLTALQYPNSRGQRGGTAHLLRLGLLMAFTMTLHNLPEGFAVAFSAYTDFGPVMAVAIAVHNIPEGIIVAAPIYAATGSRWRALALATASGLSEPLGALLALAVFKPFLTPDRLHMMLAFVGGVMLAVCAIELWPEARACKNDRSLAWGIVVGSLVMGWTLYVV